MIRSELLVGSFILLSGCVVDDVTGNAGAGGSKSTSGGTNGPTGSTSIGGAGGSGNATGGLVGSVGGGSAGSSNGSGGSAGGSGGSAGGSAGSSAGRGGSADAGPLDGDARATDASAADARADGAGADAAILLPGCDAAAWHARADESLDRLWSGFWNAGSKYFDAREPSTGSLTGYWTFEEAFDAMLDGVERTGGRKYFANIATLYAAQNSRGWSNYYYDDESWAVLTLTRAYDLTGERAYLDQAVTLYRDIIAGWDSTGVAPGGIWWNKGKGQKATASNGGPVISGVRLAARTGDASHLAFARKVYDFWFMKMVNPTTYEVADHLLADGTVSWGRLTYNEGVMIGAAQALYLATGEAKFLTHAHGFAHSLIASKAVTTSAGPVLTDGTNTGCVGDCPQWKGIGYRYLASLFRQDPRAEYRTVLEGCVQGAYTLARTPSTGYFANDWRGPPTTANSVEGQSSSATALNLFASLCGPYQGD